MKKPEKKSNNTIKAVISIVLIIGGIGYTTKSLWTYSRGIPGERDREGEFGPGPGEGGERRPGPPSPEEREQRFNQMAQEMNLTPEQRDQMTQLWQGGGPEGREGWEQRREKMQSILTPDQQQKMQGMRAARGQQFMNRRLEQAKKKLPPDQYKLYEERLKERANNMRGGRGGRGGGGGGGRGGGPGGGGR